MSELTSIAAQQPATITGESSMSLRAFTIAGFVCILLPLRGFGQSADETAVRAVVQRMFDGMRSADSAMTRSVFADGARFASVDARNTPATIKYDTVDGWIRAIANSARRWDEQIYDVQVRVDGNIAQVWAPYTFYLDKSVRHCGVDSFEFLRDTAGWNITQLSDTRRTDGCRDVLAK
jgi:hypothetical protein